MISNVDKNVILIKNIPSNMIEEAIFILKENTSDKMSEIQIELAKSESELILQNYIDEEVIKSLKDKNNEEKKHKKFKKNFLLSVFIILYLLMLLARNM